MKRSGSRRPLNSGHAAVEVTLLAPWIFFLFAGTFDVGMFSYALISTENAARTAAAYTSRSLDTAADADGACQYALQELSGLSNVRKLSTCNAAPLRVTASKVTGKDGAPASSVSVEYQTAKLIPIPGLNGQFAFKRTVEMQVK